MSKKEEVVKEEKRSLLERILDGAVESIKRPFTINKIKRAFATAKDDLDEAEVDLSQKLHINREQIVNLAKEGQPLQNLINKSLEIQRDIDEIKKRKLVLAKETREFLG